VHSRHTLKPTAYPVPVDGPVGQILTRSGRHPMRPAHIHFIVSAERHRTVTTQLFTRGDPYIDSDAVLASRSLCWSIIAATLTCHWASTGCLPRFRSRTLSSVDEGRDLPCAADMTQVDAPRGPTYLMYEDGASAGVGSWLMASAARWPTPGDAIPAAGIAWPASIWCACPQAPICRSPDSAACR
jgi:hypothetical protein